MILQNTAGIGFIHRVNVLTKIALSLVLSVLIIFFDQKESLYLIFAASFVYACLLKKYKAMFIYYLMIFVMFSISLFFSYLMGQVLSSAGAGETDITMLVPFLRVSVMSNITMVIAFSTTMDSLINSLKFLRLPSFVYFPLIVIIRFIPSFINDVKYIRESLKVRNISVNFISIIFNPILSVRLLVVPAVIRALRSSDELSVAADIKGIMESSDTGKYAQVRPGKEDLLIVVSALIVFSAGLIMERGAWV